MFAEYFHASLHRATAERPLIIHVDSLDQLSDADDGRRRLTWLPLVFPQHVYVTCSTLPDVGGCLDALRATPTPEYNYLEVPGLSPQVRFTPQPPLPQNSMSTKSKGGDKGYSEDFYQGGSARLIADKNKSKVSANKWCQTSFKFNQLH